MVQFSVIFLCTLYMYYLYFMLTPSRFKYVWFLVLCFRYTKKNKNSRHFAPSHKGSSVYKEFQCNTSVSVYWVHICLCITIVCIKATKKWTAVSVDLNQLYLANASMKISHQLMNSIAFFLNLEQKPLSMFQTMKIPLHLLDSPCSNVSHLCDVKTIFERTIPKYFTIIDYSQLCLIKIQIEYHLFHKP